MAGQGIIETLDAQGKINLSNVLDSLGGYSVQYSEITTYADGTAMSDAKAASSGGLYRKYKNKYFIQSLDTTKSRSLIVNNVSDLRGLTINNLILIRIGYYNKVETKGYYTPGDGGGIDYIVNVSSAGVDDGFLIIKPNNGLGLQFSPNIKGDINVKTAGAKGDGVKDDTLAIQNVYNKVGVNSSIFFPKGVFLIKSEITISQLRVHTKGSGKFTTQILFAPTANSICFNFTAGSTVLYQGSIQDISFFSNDSVFDKTAIRFGDISGFMVKSITISGSVNNGKASTWGGSNSIGINTCGRELSSFWDIRIAATRPVVISPNPNHSISIDQFHFMDCTFTSSNKPLVEIEDGVNLTNVTFDGYQSWNLGNHGFYWNDTLSTGNSSGLKFSNVRTEQGVDSTGYMFYINRKSTLKDVRFENVLGDINRNGFYFRKVLNVLMDTVEFTRGNAIAIDAVAIPGSTIQTVNCNFQTGGTAILSGYREVSSAPNHIGNVPLKRSAIYEVLTNTILDYAYNGETYTRVFKGTLGAGLQLNLYCGTNQGVTVAAIEATFSGATQVGGGKCMFNSLATTLIYGTTNFDIVSTAAKFCVYNSISGNSLVINRFTEEVEYIVSVLCKK